MAQFTIYYEELKAKQAEIARGEPVVLEIRNDDEMSYVKAKVLVSYQPIEGGQPASLLSWATGVSTSERIYFKVIEELPEPLVAER